MLVFSANPISTTARLPMLLYIIVSKEYLMINTFLTWNQNFFSYTQLIFSNWLICRGVMQ